MLPFTAGPARRSPVPLVALLLLVGPGCGGGTGEGGHEARLAALSVSAGELVPGFSPDVHTYSLDLGGLAAGIVVTPTAMQAGTVIHVEGQEVPSADMSDPVPVSSGGVVPILVTTVAGDGVTSSSYTILVLRAQLDSATLQAYLKKHAHSLDATGEPDYATNHFLGYSVAVDGDTLVVGAPSESGSGAGVNPAVGGSSGASGGSGAAYVFVRNGGAWTQQAYLKATQPGFGDQFGISVAVSGDRIIVGAPYEDSGQAGPQGLGVLLDETVPVAGAAYVYVRSGSTWTPDQVLKGIPHASDQFGQSVGVSGETFVVGAPGDPSSARTVNGDPGNSEAPSSGAAYVFRRNGSLWTYDYLKAPNADPNDLFGRSVAVSGDYVVVGALGESSQGAFRYPTPDDNSMGGAGAAYVFRRKPHPVTGRPTWSFDAFLKSPAPDAEDSFGRAVAISGRHVVVGALGEDGGYGGGAPLLTDNSAPDAGAAFVFSRTGVTWGDPQILKAAQPTAGDRFGTSVSVSGLLVAVGADLEDGGGAGVSPILDELGTDTGAAYVFVIGPPWLTPLYVKAHVPDPGDAFGAAVAISGDTLVVGAHGEQSIAVGVNGDATDDTGPAHGAAYVYR